MGSADGVGGMKTLRRLSLDVVSTELQLLLGTRAATEGSPLLHANQMAFWASREHTAIATVQPGRGSEGVVVKSMRNTIPHLITGSIVVQGRRWSG
jgi:hypothetical protein